MIENAKTVHLNELQQEYFLAMPRMTTGVLGRGSGKSFGFQSIFLATNAVKMPRSTQRLGAYTYEGLLTNILPGIVQGWEEIFQWREGVHFFIGKWAPDSWGWDRPHFRTRGDAKYLIHIYTGSVIQLASMDRAINNGANIDALSLDEARMIRRAKVAEMIPAMRGNLQHFGHLSNYQSLLLTTDMPQTPAEKWVLEYEDQHTQDLIDGIMMLQEDLQPLYMRYAKASGKYEQNLGYQIKKLEAEINDLRVGCTMFFEGDSLGNIDVIGRRTIESWKKTMSAQEFAVSVLNERQDKVLNGFYAALDPEMHSYDGASNYELFDEIDDPHRAGYSRDSRMDGDYFQADPLYIAFDHNAAINSLVIGQARPGNERHVINTLFVKSPHYLAELVDRFIAYYKHTKRKSLVYYYDSTSIKDNSQGQEMERDEVIRRLRAGGWRVRAKYIGKTKSHHFKYKLWNAALNETDGRLPVIRYNRVNCLQFEKSLLNADVRKVRDEYRKDKRSEQKNYRTNSFAVPPEDATHISEAADTLLIGWMDEISTATGFSDLIAV
jgi:hypothetical protein